MALPYPRVINLGDGSLDGRAVQGNFEVVDQWLSLAEAWHYVGDATTGLGTAFASGKSNFGSGYQSLRFRQDRGTVHVEGMFVDATGATSNIFTLPVNYRPTATQVVCLCN